MLQILRRHAMAAAGEVPELSDARNHESIFNVTPHVARRRAVKRQVTTLRTNDQFIARKTLPRSQLSQGSSDGSFTSLEAVVRRRVDNVSSERDRANYGVSIAVIRFLIRISQVC